LRSLPVSDPPSVVVVKWRSKPLAGNGNGTEFVMHSMSGTTFPDRSGVTSPIFPVPAFERLREVSAPVLSSLFAHKRVRDLNVVIRGGAEIAQGEYVSGDFFSGL